MVPYPFSRAVYICGEPIEVKRDAGDADMEKARARLEESLNDLTDRADRFFA